MISVRTDGRLAGKVSRYSTWPHIREQSVGEHSWQIARILLSIARRESWQRLLPHAVVHDMGELVAGDPPYPVKLENPEFGAEHRRVEDAALSAVCDAWRIPHLGVLSEAERHIFKIAEFLEMWEWGTEEMLLGNRFARLVQSRCIKKAIEMLESPLVDEGTRTRAEAYIQTREREWSDV